MAVLKSITCKGSFGIHYGMGVEEISVDFEDITGLVALIGGNGMAKTTFMEMLSPFPVLPSRKLKNPSGYNLKKQFMLRDSFKEVRYFYNDHDYVFRLEIPAGTTMSPEGYITCDGEPIVNGKISQYKKKVVELFGSEALFYSSYFSCQGGEKLTDKTTGEFKQLLIELLGLNKYNQWWHNIGKVQTAVSGELDKVVQELKVLSDKESEVDIFKAEITPMKERINGKQVSINLLDGKIKRLIDDIKTHQSEKIEVEKKETLIKEKNVQKEALEKDIEGYEADYIKSFRENEEWINAKEKSIAKHIEVVELENDILSAGLKLKDVEKEKTVLQDKFSILDQNIETGQLNIDGFIKMMTAFEKNISDLRDNPDHKKLIDEKNRLSEEYLKLKEQAVSAENALLIARDDTPLRALMLTIDNYKDAEQLLEDRPDNCNIDDCPFIVSALRSIQAKPETEKAIATWKENNAVQVEEAEKKLLICNNLLSETVEAGKVAADLVVKSDEFLKNKIEEISGSRDAVEKEKTAAEEKLFIARRDKANTKYNIDELAAKEIELQKIAKLKPQLETAKEIKHAAKEEIFKKKQALNKAAETHRSKREAKQSEIDAINQIIISNYSEHNSNYFSSMIYTNEKELENSQQSKKDLEFSINEAEKKIAVLEDKAKLSDDDAKKIKTLKEKESLIRKELKKWDYIRAGLSKSGIQALEIASAAPLLTGIANDLLHSAFGGEFYVDLVTLDPETGAEILEVMITREDGESFPLSEYSGGESVWILQAFKAAQILVNTEKSGIHFMTAFCDEETGALDKEKAERFISMYRALMEKGGFEKLFYISHLPDCQAMADRSLVFKPGGIEVI